MFRRWLATLVAFSALCASAIATLPAGEPLALHPDNGRYFLWRGQPTILVTSAEHYGALLNLDFDFDRYFAALQRDGLNHTRVFAGTYRELPGSHGIANNTLAPAPERYLAPWARSDQPGYHDGGNKFDLTRIDPAYLERLKALLGSADKHGIVVELTLFCPLYGEGEWLGSPFHPKNNVNGLGDWPKDETLSLKHPQAVAVQEAFVREVVRSVNGFDNLYFEVCNEPYIRKVPDDWQAHIVKTITATERELPRKHLISLNVANGRARVTDPPAEVSIFNFHYCVPPDVVALNAHLSKLIGENETGFRGRHDVLYRTEGWDFLLAGGGLYNNLDYSFTIDHPEGDLRGFRAPGGGSAELRRQLGVLKRFIEGFDFVRMKPMPDVVRSASEKLTWQALGLPGEAWAVYLHVPLPNKPKNVADHLRKNVVSGVTLDLPAGAYVAEWVSPLTGETLKTDRWNQPAGTHELQTPPFDDDVALRLRREGAPPQS